MSLFNEKTDSLSAAKQNKTLKAVDFPFEILESSKILDKESFLNKKELEELILSMCSTFKLKSYEISSFLVEQEFISESDLELRRFIKNLVRDEKLKLTEDELLRPVEEKSSKLDWSLLSREKSSEIIEKSTKINSFFTMTRPIYNNLIKSLNRDNKNHYFLNYEPGSEVMEVKHKGKTGIMFASNDYLGLSKHPEVLDTAKKSIEDYGVGGCGSRITVGTFHPHLELEETISKFNGSEATTVLSSGYITNLTLFSIIRPDTAVFFDALCHACIIDGIKLSGANAIRFKHNDTKDLEEKLEKNKDIKHKLIVVESIYSLDGDLCRFPEIVELSKQYNAYLAVDEAHSTGVLGSSGRGIAEHFGLDPSCIDFKVGTLSKAIGSEGGYFSTASHIMEAVKYSHTPYMFTTSRCFPAVAAANKAIQIIMSDTTNIKRLQNKSEFMRNEIVNLGYNIGESETQIIPILHADEADTFKLHEFLFERGIFTIVAVYPAVPKKKSRVRINISALHTDEHLNLLLNILGDFRKKNGYKINL